MKSNQCFTVFVTCFSINLLYARIKPNGFEFCLKIKGISYLAAQTGTFIFLRHFRVCHLLENGKEMMIVDPALGDISKFFIPQILS